MNVTIQEALALAARGYNSGNPQDQAVLADLLEEVGMEDEASAVRTLPVLYSNMPVASGWNEYWTGRLELVWDGGDELRVVVRADHQGDEDPELFNLVVECQDEGRHRTYGNMTTLEVQRLLALTTSTEIREYIALQD